LLEGVEAIAEGHRCSFDGWRFFNFGDERRADDGSVGEATKNGHMARKRDAETDGDRKLRDTAGPPEESREIVGQGILRARNAGAGD
jgi:hypothetical protein